MMKYIDIRAIVLATLAVFGIDFVTGIILFSVFTDQVANASEEQVRAAAAALATDPGYLRAALVLGTASTVVGGFLVARIARSVAATNPRMPWSAPPTPATTMSWTMSGATVAP